MDLQDESTVAPGLFEQLVEAHECDLEDVGGQTLDACVHGLTFAGLSDTEVRGRQFRDLTTSSEQGLGVPPLPGLGHGSIHIRVHGGERFEIRIKDLLCLPHPHTQSLGKAVGLHAVGESVADHLGLRPLLQGDRSRVDVEDAGGSGVVDVLPGFEGPDQARILGEMRDAAQFDLVVVGDEKRESLRRHEGPTEGAPEFGANRDVVQVRSI